MEREACVSDHGYERSDLCAEIIIIIIYITKTPRFSWVPQWQLHTVNKTVVLHKICQLHSRSCCNSC